ncbi:MAG: hypothetical protein ACKO5J_03895 [Rubrivivax sp.]
MHAPTPRHTARRLIAVALLALVLGQWTALAHSIGHAHLPDDAAAPAVDDHGAWGHQAGTQACQLVDHLLSGQAAGGGPAPLVVVPPAA